MALNDFLITIGELNEKDFLNLNSAKTAEQVEEEQKEENTNDNNFHLLLKRQVMNSEKAIRTFCNDGLEQSLIIRNASSFLNTNENHGLFFRFNA